MTVNEYWSLWEESGVELQPVKRKKPKTTRTAKPETVPSSVKTLEGVQKWLGSCTRCGLCRERNKIVFGSGNPKARLMFIGEGPGADEARAPGDECAEG